MDSANNSIGFGPPPAEMSRAIRDCFEYWDSKRAGRVIPDRHDLEPLSEVPHLIPNMWLLDVVPSSPRRYRFRLIGDVLSQAGATARVGDFLDQTERVGTFDDIQSALERSVEEKLTFWASGTPRLAHEKYVARIETISLPLTVGGSDDVRMVLNATAYTQLRKA